MCSIRRFEHASEVMSYTGLVPSEHSSGAKKRRGKITKTGNSASYLGFVQQAS
jgi:transposase